MKTTSLAAPLPGECDGNVSARALREVVRIAYDARPDTVRVNATDNTIVFEIGTFTLSAPLIDGEFPDCRTMVPEAFKYELLVGREGLTDVVRRITLCAQGDTPVRLSLSPGKMIVSVETPELGEARESLPISFYGDPLHIGFSPQFLRAGIEGVNSDNIVIKFTGPLGPCVIESADREGYLYVVMPIRLSV